MVRIYSRKVIYIGRWALYTGSHLCRFDCTEFPIPFWSWSPDALQLLLSLDLQDLLLLQAETLHAELGQLVLKGGGHYPLVHKLL